MFGSIRCNWFSNINDIIVKLRDLWYINDHPPKLQNNTHTKHCMPLSRLNQLLNVRHTLHSFKQWSMIRSILSLCTSPFSSCILVRHYCWMTMFYWTFYVFYLLQFFIILCYIWTTRKYLCNVCVCVCYYRFCEYYCQEFSVSILHTF